MTEAPMHERLGHIEAVQITRTPGGESRGGGFDP
jgi:hypothetical protein